MIHQDGPGYVGLANLRRLCSVIEARSGLVFWLSSHLHHCFGGLEGGCISKKVKMRTLNLFVGGFASILIVCLFIPRALQRQQDKDVRILFLLL